jgi:hypothetical protein
VLNTTIIDARPEHRYELAIDSIYPLLLAIVVGLTMLWFIFSPWAIPGGAAGSLIILYMWFWRGNQPQPFQEVVTSHSSPARPPAEPQPAT